MALDFLEKFWDEKRSLCLTKALTVVIAALCAAAVFSGPKIITWLLHERHLNVTGPAVGAALLVIGYFCAALAFWMLYNLYGFLHRLQMGDVFVPANITALRRISWCCALAALMCFGTGIVVYIPFLFLGCAAGFMALIVRVIKNAFQQALRMKNELDFTV